MDVEFKKLDDGVKLPRYAHNGDAGMDVFAAEEKTLAPGERYCFQLGFAMKFPRDYVCHVWDKSGLAMKHGITCLAGVIDATYRGEVGVVLLNTGETPVTFRHGDKIAQLVFTKIEHARPVETDDLADSERGDGGFGSTGRT